MFGFLHPGTMDTPPVRRAIEGSGPDAEPLLAGRRLLATIIAISDGKALADHSAVDVETVDDATHQSPSISVNAAAATGKRRLPDEGSQSRPSRRTARINSRFHAAGLTDLRRIDPLETEALIPLRERITVHSDEPSRQVNAVVPVELGGDEKGKKKCGRSNHAVAQKTEATIHNLAHFENESFAIMANKTLFGSIFLTNGR